MRNSPPSLLRFAARSTAFVAVLATGGWVLGARRGVHSLESAWPDAAAKWATAHHGESPANAVVFGSSVVRHHLIPSLLDSVTAPLGLRWHNLGISASFPPESYAIAEAFLRSPEADRLAYMVFDVLPLEPPHIENAGTLRRAASVDAQTWSELVRLSAGDVSQQAAWSALFASHVLGGWRLETGEGGADTDRLHRGFVPLDTLEVRWDALYASRQAFLKDPEGELNRLASEAADFDYRFSGQIPDPCIHWHCPPNAIAWHLTRMEELQRLARDRGIRLVFCFQKLWETNGCLYEAALEAWGEGRVIELMGAAEGGERFERRHWFDAAHLTPSGARVLTRDLAYKLLKAGETRP